MLQSFAGGALFGSATGSPPARVLALHGWARTHRDFDAVVRAPNSGAPDGGPALGGAALGGGALDAVAVDLPGFGATPPPPEPWGAAAYAARVAAMLDEGELATPVVVLGHSFGGRVAVCLAASRPELVRSLVLTGVPLLRTAPGRRPSPGFRLVRGLHRVGLIGDDRMERARQQHGSADYRAAEGIMRQVLVRSVGETYEEQLAAIDCPVRLVWGDDDRDVPLTVAERAAGLLADAQVTVCPGAGHLTPLTVPGTLRAAVDELLG
jgi:pimeloyl-ACP methyl ester carboxylesterase